MNHTQQQGNGKSDQDFLIVNRTETGYRVYAAARPSVQYAVSGPAGDRGCNCNSFADDQTCEHVRAVLEQVREDEQVEHEERQAIQGNGKPTPKRRNSAKGNAPAILTLKRSVSPDGRIDSLSVEFSCPVDQIPNAEISSRADKMLALQTEIAAGFLRNGSAKSPNGNGSPPAPANGNIPAQMLHVGSFNGRFGPRLFIAVKAGSEELKLFGTAKQLAEALNGAGYQFGEHDIAEGIYLNLPCQITTKPSRDGRYTNIERVLPSNAGNARHRGAS